MGQIAWSKSPSLAVALNLPDPPPSDSQAMTDWMQKVNDAMILLSQESIELQEFLDDILEAVRPLQLISNNIFIGAGNGTPEGTITANIGSLFLRTDGGVVTTLYVKTSGTGNTGWTAK